MELKKGVFHMPYASAPITAQAPPVAGYPFPGHPQAHFDQQQKNRLRLALR